jgi:hypothetical protein
MISDTDIRNQLIKRIQNIPPDMLPELNVLITKLEKSASRKAKNLSYAGMWSDIDNDLFKDFSENLIQNRQRNKRRHE